MKDKDLNGVTFTDHYSRYICRGKDKDGNWVVGIYLPLTAQIQYADNNPVPVIKTVDVDPKTICHRIKVSTYGREDRFLFEGDVDVYGYVVSYVSRETSVSGESTGMTIGWYRQRDNFESWGPIEIGEEIIIVGNIFDDPELPNRIRRQLS